MDTKIGLIIIGDEILSGKRQDQHLHKVIELLNERGLQLAWAQYVGDDPDRIRDTFKRSFASGDVVFSTGGIGATPDDHTRESVARVLNLPLQLHPQAKCLIQERILSMAKTPEQADLNTPTHLHSLKMGEFPQGADIIPNPFNQIPGFFIRQHYFVPGFPVMAWPMLEWVLDTHYAHLFHTQVVKEKSLLVYEIAESTLTPLMESIEKEFTSIKVFSLPSVGTETVRRHIELGVKGVADQVEPAFHKMLEGLKQFTSDYELIVAK